MSRVMMMSVDLADKLRILGGAARYDSACTSSGSSRGGVRGMTGNAVSCGICHSFSADGRCVSLLKVLLTNHCVNDCKYCYNRSSNDIERAAFTPEELADLTMSFYKRNYIEGLFLSSGIVRDPDYTMELMCRVLTLLRGRYGFNGYIHAKAIPGGSAGMISRLGRLTDRLSVNIELPSERSLVLLAPQKDKEKILNPMGLIREGIRDKDRRDFAPAGQSTQMIIGATPDTDYQILRLSESLYRKFELKRVFYSAYIPVGDHPTLPVAGKPPLLREHRLYQADWLLRFYGFSVEELLDQRNPALDPVLDPKCQWALRHMELFPVEVNRADYSVLLRVPGIGVRSAKRICVARRTASLDFEHLRKLGVVLKRAVYFITCKGRRQNGLKINEGFIYRNLAADVGARRQLAAPAEQLSFFSAPDKEDAIQCVTGEL
jgi:putative DNA modification/repair radical SAM protein